MRLLLAFPEDLPGSLEHLRRSPSPAVIQAAEAIRQEVDHEPGALTAPWGPPLRPEGVKLDRWEWRDAGRRGVQFAILDKFFGLHRVAAGTPEMCAHSAVVAYRTLLLDTVEFGTGLSVADWNTARHGLRSIIAAGVDDVRPRRFDVPIPARTAEGDPHLRWRSGHQVFFPLIQATIVALRSFATAVTEEQPGTAESSLLLAADCMAASAAAMQWAADFGPSEYAAHIRPSMTPPGVAQSLSGLMSADHHQLVRTYHELRPLGEGLDSRTRSAMDVFVGAVARAYDAHVHVCDRFNGNRVASLRMNQTHSMTASEVLSQLGQARLRMLESAP